MSLALTNLPAEEIYASQTEKIDMSHSSSFKNNKISSLKTT